MSIALRIRMLGGLAVTAILTAALASACMTRPATQAPPVNPTPLPSSAAASLPPPLSLPSPLPSSSRVDLNNATIDVPAFPEGDCKGGRRTFKNGRILVGDSGATGDIELVLTGKAVKAELDGDAAVELVVPITCANYVHYGQVLALKVVAPGKYRTLGFVLNSTDHKTFDVYDVQVKGKTVLADLLSETRPDGPRGVLDLQTRGYEYRAGKFRQVSGPSKFAAAPADYKDLDVRNTTVAIRVGDDTGYVKLHNGSGEITVGAVRYSVRTLSTAVFAQRPSIAALFELRSSSGTVVIGHVYDFHGPAVAELVALIHDVNGATALQAFGDRLKITINNKVFEYAETQGGGQWRRL